MPQYAMSSRARNVDRVNRRQLSADLMLLLVTLVWGGTFVMVKDAVASFPVFPFLTLRFGLASLVLLPFGARRLRTLGWRSAGAGVLIGLFLLAGYSFQTIGLRYTSASKAGLITGLSVVIVPIMSALILHRAPRIEAIVGVALATIGLALLSVSQKLTVTRGDILVVFCAFSFALYIVSVSAFAPKVDPVALTLVQMITVALVCALVSLFTESSLPQPSGATWVAAAFTGIFATAVAFLIQTSMQRFTTPTHTALVLTGEPVFAAIFGVLLAHDVLTARNIAGGILILSGTIVSEIRWSQRTAHLVSRFLGPQYVAMPLLLAIGLADPVSPLRGILWASAIGVLSVGVPVLLLMRELRRGGISDWHISRREERLQIIPVLSTLAGAALPLPIMYFLHGPRPLFVAYASILLLILFNLAITMVWKISQHVAAIAASTTLISVILGISAAPALLLIPLVAWARVKVGAHTVMQTIAGGVTGIVITLATLRFFGLA